MTSASRVCLAGSQRTHPGRPETEDPHVKKTMKGKKEITEYICKVDQDELGIMEDEFDDLKDLFKVVTIFVLTLTLKSSLQMFDVDQDGILNLMEAQHVLGCLGFRGTSAESVNIRNNVYRSIVRVIPIPPQLVLACFIRSDCSIGGGGQCG